MMAAPLPYQVTHTAPADDGYSQPVTRLAQSFAADVYERPDLYTGDVDPETMTQLVTARDDQAALLRIYRALPEEHDEINTGDWVTLSRDYAEQHAASEGWPVIYADVPAGQVFTDGNDLAEFGYTGPILESLPQLPEDTAPPAPAQQPHQVKDRDQAQTQISPDSLDGATSASPHVVGPDTPLARQDQHGTIAARIDALTARVNADRDQDNTDSHPRTGAAQQRWDDGPAAHQQAPTRHQ